MKQLVRDFRDFALKGNFIDLAVAVVIGVAFNAVVNSLVNDVIMPIVAAIIGKPNFDELTIVIGSTAVYYGRFLTAVVNFLIIAATRSLRARPSHESSPHTCEASSRVGTSTRPTGRCG